MSSAEPAVRALRGEDVPSALTLSRLAGWNQTASDWSLLLRLDATGCLAIERHGEVVATTTLMCYGKQLGWIGMVLTHPEYRRRGFARRLVESALQQAEARQIECVKLDATDQGLPLYESLGFRREQAIERWYRDRDGMEAGADSVCEGRPDLELDLEAFGADRSELLRLLSMADHGGISAVRDGYAMARAGARGSYLGPCVSRSPESAKRVIERCLSTAGGLWFWDLLPLNRNAIQVAEDLGFKPARKLVRMVKGRDFRGEETMNYAGAGFELG